MIENENEFGVKGKRIAILANLSHKKGVMLFLHAFKAIYDYDQDFTLHLAGRCDEMRFGSYMDYIIPKLGIGRNLHYYGFVEKPLKWLEDKDFLFVSSPWEGCPVGVLEAMSLGKTMLIHSFVGSDQMYPDSFIWSSIPELLEMIKKGPGDPQIYKNFVKENYSQDKQFKALDKIISDLLKDTPDRQEVKKDSSISAIIAVKNGEKTIERAINSLLYQTKPLEKIIVVDDGSTDNTSKILNRLKYDSDIPIQIISNTQSRWVFSARNQGFGHCSSDYFFFLDHDDWVDKRYSEELSKVLDENDAVSVAYPDLVYFNNKGDEKVFNQPEFSVKALAQQNFIAYSSLQRTSSFKEIGGFSEYMNDCRNHMTEWALWLNYLKHGFSFKRCPEPLFHYFHDDAADQMSSGYERSRDNMQLELALEISDNHSEIQMLDDGKKRIVLVCHGREYLDKSKVSFEVYTWYKSLEEFGNVYTFFYDVDTQYYGHTAMLERLQNFINLVKPDYIFHPSYKDDIPVSVWSDLSKAYNTIVWNSDNHRYVDFCKEYDKGFGYAVTTYNEVYKEMKHSGKILSQWACNQHYFGPKEKDIDVSFCGQQYGERAKFLDGLGVECYGGGWATDSFLDFPKMSSVLGRSKISINFSKGGDGGPQLKLRPFEICGSNTLCLCEYVAGIEQWYNIGVEIITFKTREELSILIDYYLKNDAERIEIAQNGYERTIKDHLWSNRLKAIFKTIDKGETK